MVKSLDINLFFFRYWNFKSTLYGYNVLCCTIVISYSYINNPFNLESTLNRSFCLVPKGSGFERFHCKSNNTLQWYEYSYIYFTLTSWTVACLSSCLNGSDSFLKARHSSICCGALAPLFNIFWTLRLKFQYQGCQFYTAKVGKIG